MSAATVRSNREVDKDVDKDEFSDEMMNDDDVSKPSANDVIHINRQQVDNNADDDRTQALDRQPVIGFTHQSTPNVTYHSRRCLLVITGVDIFHAIN